MDDRGMVLFLATFVLIVFIHSKIRNRSVLPFPPGPKKLPLLGNLLDLPKSFEWVTYARWGKEYNSDIIHLRAVGNDFIVLNSFNVANELLDQRSSIYSSRPQFTVLSELMGWKWLLSAMVYGEPWKERRRLFLKYFNLSNSNVYQPIQTEFVRKMLIRLLETPDDFLGITRHAIGGMALSLAYGIPIQQTNDPYIELAEKAVASISESTIPGAILVDIIPSLKYVFKFIPGWNFKEKVKHYRELQTRFHNLPFDETVKNMASGVAKPSFASICLENLDETGNVNHQKEVIKDTAGIVFAAGADTTLSNIHSLFVAMLHYPDVQAKAHEELDRVLGGRLPEFSDEPDLPYLSALAKELLRWQPATPIAVPHYASEDDVYEGYHIPKGAIVIGNAWAMLHDEEIYPDPSVFKPERFLNKDGQLDASVRDPALAAFGFGRRICPGSHIGVSVLWMTAATVLSTFKISKALDEDGFPIEPSVQYQSGLICHPMPFRCTIKPRSRAAEVVIRSAADSY